MDRKKLGSAPIIGAGTNILPGYGSQAMVKVDMREFLGVFLACTTYLDEAGANYEQAFLFEMQSQQQPNQPMTALEELPSANIKLCR
jgi:hypothetical protein